MPAADGRGHRTGVILAALSLTFAAGGAIAADRTGGKSAASVRAAGSTVAALQSALGIPADGIYGPQTRAAVRRFQRSQRARGRRHRRSGDARRARPQRLDHDRQRQGGAVSAPSGTLAKIAACESGGNPAAVSATGRYRGKYQFSRATWREMGGVGDPREAPEAEQDRIAATAARRARHRPLAELRLTAPAGRRRQSQRASPARPASAGSAPGRRRRPRWRGRRA